MKNTKALTVVAVVLAAILLLAQNVMAEAAVDQAMRQTAALRAQELARELQIERQEQRQMADLLFQQALPLIEQGEYRKAHTLLSEALKRCPNHVESNVKIIEVNSALSRASTRPASFLRPLPASSSQRSSTPTSPKRNRSTR